MVAGKVVSREEKRDATAVSRRPFLVLTVKFIRRERSSPDRFAKFSFDGGFLDWKTGGTPVPLSQVDSRNSVRPSSNWISSGFHVGRWSKPSGSGFEEFRGRLNQSKSDSSSGIHHSIACQSGRQKT